jgi:hypothetical protein
MSDRTVATIREVLHQDAQPCARCESARIRRVVVAFFGFGWLLGLLVGWLP